MPEIRDYVVTQTRRVKVTANSMIDAQRIAESAFRHGQNSNHGALKIPPEVAYGNTTTPIMETKVTVERI